MTSTPRDRGGAVRAGRSATNWLMHVTIGHGRLPTVPPPRGHPRDPEQLRGLLRILQHQVDIESSGRPRTHTCLRHSPTRGMPIVNCNNLWTGDGRKYITGLPRHYEQLKLRCEVPVYAYGRAGNSRPREIHLQKILIRWPTSPPAGAALSVGGIAARVPGNSAWPVRKV